jgi:hypothetical protein
MGPHVGKRFKEDIFDDAEHSGIGADADSKREYCDCRKAGLPTAAAKGVSQVLDNGVDQWKSA